MGDHADCAATLASLFESQIVDGMRPAGRAIVSTIRVVAPDLEEAVFSCPHGVTYWVAPDAEMQRWLHETFGDKE